MSEERDLVGFASPVGRNYKLELDVSLIHKLSSMYKNSESKRVFVCMVNGDEMRSSQQAYMPMERVSCTYPKPVKSTKRNLKKTAKLLDFTVFELLESRREARQR